PQPTAFDQLPPPEASSRLQTPPPSCLRATIVMGSGQEELAIVFKRTYIFEHRQIPQPTDEQPPLVLDFIPYQSVGANAFASFKDMPEVVGYKTGTDLVIRGSARADAPTRQMRVAVELNGRSIQQADVLGSRFCEYLKGELRFSLPEPFESMPLRYENAYGGRDLLCETEFLEQLYHAVPGDDLRRIRPAAEEIFSSGSPLMYPRNRFGKGYVLEDRRDLVEGRELPNLERPEDRLAPETIIVGNPLNWVKQPLPIGFDYLEPAAFPRCAMMGLPPATLKNPGPIQEVECGYIPGDYSRGNIFTCAKESVPKLIHPQAGHCASLGLWQPFFKGRETIILKGMDPQYPTLEVNLPGETPLFSVPGLQRHPVDLDGQLYLVHIDTDRRLLTLVWTGRTTMPSTLQRFDLLEIERDLKLNLRKE
ncbi:MAG: DUF2169 domain-containing protein, partial [Desulfobacterales bacterium]